MATPVQKPAKKRGFAAMSPEKRRAIASRGGSVAHQRGTAHQFTSEEAKKAGRKGGKAVSRDRRHMATIGKKGGVASGIQRGSPEEVTSTPYTVLRRQSEALTPDGRRTLEANRHLVR